MAVIAVVNRKGGSGKSTLATHLAAYCAHAGLPVMLGDMDRQQSTQSWLRLRQARVSERCPAIMGWSVDPRNVLRPPAGIQQVILDTPGGLRGFDLARVSIYADAILIPICHSAFDRESTADCFAELMTLPRVASGQCRIAAVGMRIDGRTRAADALEDWAAGLGLKFLGALREAQAYVRCVEQGLTLFDLPASQTPIDRVQWAPILEWVEPILHSTRRPPVGLDSHPPRVVPAGSERLRPTPLTITPRAPGLTNRALPSLAPLRTGRLSDSPASSLFGWLPLPRFLQRGV
ncbi:MAG: ParA family protein [Caldimonas sp.]